VDIRPFRGWRFCAEADGDVSALIAPPYDVLTADDKQQLLARSDRNIVAVDLPHVPPKEAGPQEVYQQAAARLERWKADGVIRREDRPALYVYEQTFSWAGKTYIRRALLGGVRATELGQDVIPHEHTFAGPKADRLKLTQCTGMQLSPIFGFYTDADRAVSILLSEAAAGPPDLHGTLGDVGEKLWAVTDEDVIARIAALLADVPVFIADGHHRYTTAMNYRDSLPAAASDDDHPAHFVMFALVARDDPGLQVLPTHRIVYDLAPSFSIDKLVEAAGAFAWQRCGLAEADLADAGAFLQRYGTHAMGLLGADPAAIRIATLRDSQAMVAAAPDELEVWRDLDVAILHKLIVDRALKPWRMEETRIEYTPDARAALAACRSGQAQLAVCLQPTPLEAVEQIALAGAAMPHKSTYFYPKLATGMVLKPVEPAGVCPGAGEVRFGRVPQGKAP